MIQESAVFAAIKKGVGNRIVQDLTKFAEAEPDKFATVWENFGGVIKEGLYEDPERRDSIYKIALFATSTHPDGKRTLAEYVAGLKTNQTSIYYMLGEDLKRLQASPQLEGFAARGIEVLLLPDPIDAFWVGSAAGYEGKPFKSISQGAADIKDIPLEEGNEKPSAEATPCAGLAVRADEGRRSARRSRTCAPRTDCPRVPLAWSRRTAVSICGSSACWPSMASSPARARSRVLEVNPAHPLIGALAGHVEARRQGGVRGHRLAAARRGAADGGREAHRHAGLFRAADARADKGGAGGLRRLNGKPPPSARAARSNLTSQVLPSCTRPFDACS